VNGSKVERLVAEIQKRIKYYQRQVEKPVQVKRQYFRGKLDAFLEVQELLKKEALRDE